MKLFETDKYSSTERYSTIRQRIMCSTIGAIIANAGMCWHLSSGSESNAHAFSFVIAGVGIELTFFPLISEIQEARSIRTVVQEAENILIENEMLE